MTQTEQWIMCLALVYAVPSFLAGIGLTLLWVRWRNHRRTKAGVSVHRAASDPLENSFRTDKFSLLRVFENEPLIGT